MIQHALKLGVAVVFCVTAISCASDDTDGGGSGGTAGTGGIGGASGMMGGAAGTGGVGGGGTGGTAGGGTGGTAGGGSGGTAGGGTGGTAGGGTGGTGGMPLTGDPTWSAIFTEIVMAKGCNQGAACHGGAGGMLMMTDADTAYTALFDVMAMGVFPVPNFESCNESGLKRVAPNDPDMSLLVQKLAGTQTCGTQMPPGGPTQLIPAEQLEQVRMWIAAGALKN